MLQLETKNESFMERNIYLYKITLFEVLYVYTLRDIPFNAKLELLKKAKIAIRKMPITKSLNLINVLKIAFNNSVFMFYILRKLTSKFKKLKSKKD